MSWVGGMGLGRSDRGTCVYVHSVVFVLGAFSFPGLGRAWVGHAWFGRVSAMEAWCSFTAIDRAGWNESFPMILA